MKNNCLIILAVILFACGCGRKAPRDELGNPVFNSRQLRSLAFSDWVVDTLYYTMTNNIADRGSAFFVADSPTADQAFRFATRTPAYCFIIHTNRDPNAVAKVSAMVVLDQYPRDKPGQRFAFRIIRPSRRGSVLVPLKYGEMIPDLRAYELAEGPWDPSAEMLIEDGKPLFVFRGKTNAMLLFSTVLEDLRDLVNQRELHKMQE